MSLKLVVLWPVSRSSLCRELHNLGPSTDF